MVARVLLLSTPWAYYTMPSIQIGALKAYLRAHDIEVEADHAFLRVAAWMGFENYNAVWTPHLEEGEALYGGLVFPEQRGKILRSRWFRDKALVVQTEEGPLPADSEAFLNAFERFHDRYLDRFDWAKIGLVGLSLNFAQTLSSVYFARRIKKRAPHVRVVIGGAEATGQLGRSLLREFDVLDFCCHGEGERPLLSLARDVATGRALAPDWRPPPGILTKRALIAPAFNEVARIEELPPPDYADYFNAIGEMGMHPAEVCDCLPFETSRGCYYSCNFCALNLQWSGYRESRPETAAERIADLRRHYRMLDFFFVDNITPTAVAELARRLAEHGVDYRFFYEARANLPRETWRELARAGVRKVQIGVEALSTDLLRVYNKRAKVIHNLAALKHCFHFGIRVTANLILGHPHTTEAHVRETLDNMVFASAYPPIDSISPYALFLGAPDAEEVPEGVEIVGNHALYGRAYPAEVLARLDLPRKDFRLPPRAPAVSYRPIREALSRWRDHHRTLETRYGGDVRPLAYYDGGSFLRIDDLRGPRKRVYVLDEEERRAYLAFNDVAHLHQGAQRAELPPARLREMVREFEEEHLMFVEEGRALALAIPARRP